MKVRTLTACFLFLATHATAATEEFVRVKSSSANLRAEPNTNSQVVVTASLGAVFKVFDRSAGWVEVAGPSGEARYISAPLVESVAAPPPFPESQATLRAACHDFVAAQDRANREAQERYSDPDFHRQIEYQRVLNDRYELPVLHRYGIAPAYTSHLTGICARNRWF